MDVTASTMGMEMPVSFQSQLGCLIESVGKSDFAGSLFRVLRSMTGCEQLIVFNYKRGGAPRTLLSEHSGVVSNFDRRNGRYMQHFWRHDPVHRLDEDTSLGPAYLARIELCDIASRSYREECFTDVSLGSRVSLVRTENDEITRLNIYLRGRGAFESDAIDQLDAASPVVDSLLRRHAADCTRTSHRLGGPEIRDRLKDAAPCLTPRELEVCTHIARGLTSEGIALELDISRNTVLTFRKRAYARLNIATQNELMHLIMS